MRAVSRRGWTLAELVVALTLTSLVAGTAVGLLLSGQRQAARAAAAAARETERRAAALLVSGELRGLDPVGSDGDLLGAWPDSLIYRVTLGLHVACSAPIRLPGGEVRIPLGGRALGRASLDPADQGVLLFWSGDGAPQRWSAARLTTVEPHPVCPGGGPGRVITLAGLVVPEPLPSAALVRTFGVHKLAAYADRDGLWWLGVQSRDPHSGGPRGTIQPALGPLAARGLSIAYLDATDTPVRDPENTVRIRITLVFAAGNDAVTDTLVLEVGLWNRSGRTQSQSR